MAMTMRDAATELRLAADAAQAAAQAIRELAAESLQWDADRIDRPAWIAAWGFFSSIALCAALDMEAVQVCS